VWTSGSPHAVWNLGAVWRGLASVWVWLGYRGIRSDPLGGPGPLGGAVWPGFLRAHLALLDIS
jgi:hypothetical protein